MTIIHFDIAAFIITVILLVSAVLRKQYKDRTNLIMFLLLLMVFVSTVGDLGGAVIGNYLPANETNRVAMYIFNVIYFVSHILLVPIYLLYAYSSIDVWHLWINRKTLRHMWTIPVLAVELLFLTNSLHHKMFYITEDLVYVRGSLLIIAYVIAVFYGIWSLKVIFKYKHVINKDKEYTLLFLIVLVGAAVVLQAVMPNVLIEMFTISSAIMFYMVVVRREEAQVDPITGALRHVEGLERIGKNIVTQKPASVIAVKIDNYKNINLHLGQEAYHAFLKETADNLREYCKEYSFPEELYYFDDGLFVILGDKKMQDKAVEITSKIKEVYEKSYSIAEFVVFPDVKQCVVTLPEDVIDKNSANSLFSTFNKTMPADSSICIYSEYKEDREFGLRSDMDEIIERALERNGFEIYYQPIYSTVEKRFVAAEALLRLNDIKYGFVSPRYFIPAAENSGQIHAIGDFVLESVVRFISETDMLKLGLKYIEINLSASQCIEADLVEKITGAIEKYGIKPEQLSLEITETAANINPTIVDMNIEQLHSEGIRFALDDYGTGYSNIKRVVSLPVDQVKLDKTFVDMIDDPNMWIVIQDTINMLKEMGKEVLVEGIEDADVAARFTELRPDLIQGCELIQGFYFCKPLPKYEFIQFMQDHIENSVK